MGSTNRKIGQYLELVEVSNSGLEYGTDRVRGVNNHKKLMPTRADLTTRDLSKFQVVRPGDFVFNHRTSRNGGKFSIAFNDGAEDVICTEDYVVFHVREDAKGSLSALWLYMFFNRAEFDRYVITNSWGSSTEFFNWEDLCDIEIDLPPLPVQEKYVAVYKAMLANQSAYEKGLSDLKLACDAYVEELKRKSKKERIGEWLRLSDARNEGSKYKADDVRGLSTSKQIIPTVADVNGVGLSGYKIFAPHSFAYVADTSRRGDKVSLGYNDTEETFLVSPIAIVFSTDETHLLPAYLMAFFSRSEFDRYARFNSWGSAREMFNWEDMCDVKIPLVDMETQQAVADMFVAYRLRAELNEKLKAQVQQACPILIKGSLDEARKARSRRKEVLS